MAMFSFDQALRKRPLVEFTDGEEAVEDLILETIMRELMYGYSSPTNEESSGPYVYPPEANSRPPGGNNPKKRKFHVNNISKNLKIIRVPRVLNSDIRKKYPTMIINVLNSCNHRYMKEFINTYTNFNTLLTWNHSKCGACCTKSHEFAFYSDSQERRSVAFRQMSDISNYLFFSSLTVPDRVYEVIHSDIVTRSDSYETKIIVYYRMSGMKSYHCNPIHAGVIVESYASTSASSPCSCSSSSGSTVTTDDSKSSLSVSDDEEFSMLKLFYQKIERIDFPRHLTAHGKITMTVENYQESMKINQIVIESSSNLYHFRPL